MKRFFKSKIGRFILVILGVSLMAVLFTLGYAIFIDKRQNNTSDYYIALVNKRVPYTKAEINYMIAVQRYRDPLFFIFKENKYRKYLNSSTENLSDAQKQDYLVDWADKYQQTKPRELKARESWLPGTNIAIPIPKQWQQTYKDRQAPLDFDGKYGLIINSKDNSGAFVFFEAGPGRDYKTAGDYAATKDAKRFAKIDKSKYAFANELKRQERIRFNRNLDNVANVFNLTHGIIDYAPLKLQGQTIYIYQQKMTYSDGDVIESIYHFKVGHNIVTANIYYPAKDKDKFEKAIEQAIAEAHTFNLDYMRPDEPSHHGITKQEEKEKQAD
ncbi:hypothetical protein ACVRXF_07325 [Streptococcus orisasini]